MKRLLWKVGDRKGMCLEVIWSIERFSAMELSSWMDISILECKDTSLRYKVPLIASKIEENSSGVVLTCFGGPRWECLGVFAVLFPFKEIQSTE